MAKGDGALHRHGTGHQKALTAVVATLVLFAALGLPTRLPSAAAGGAVPSLALYLTEPAKVAGLRSALLAAGASIAHEFPAAGFVAQGPQWLPEAMAGQGAARLVATTAVDPERAAALGVAARAAAVAWNAIVDWSMGDALAALGGAEDLAPPPGDTLVPDDVPILAAQAFDQSLYQQSEYLIGRIVVNIVLPESDGSLDASTEDWSSAEEQLVLQQVVKALEWWRSMEPRAGLEFVYNGPVRVPVSYEPISRPHTDERLWISQAMEKLGYSHPSYITAVRKFNSAERARHGADWALTVFVVDSSSDADNRFSDGYFAYAYLFGPFCVMTYGNDGYGPENMAAVLAHEVGHIFGALDEYAEANVPPSAIGGYLGIPNLNTEAGGQTNYPCIMRGGLKPFREKQLCPYSAGQVGWRDTDGDGILDPVDTFPAVSISVQTDATSTTVRALVEDQPWPSPQRLPISINKIAGAEFRANDGRWLPLPHAPGTPEGGNTAEFGAVLPPAPQGEWVLEVRSSNTVGNTGRASARLSVAQGEMRPSVNLAMSLEVNGQTLIIRGESSCTGSCGFIQVALARLDSGEWFALTPTDGAFDSPREALYGELSAPAGGKHAVEAVAWASSPWAAGGVWAGEFTAADDPEPTPQPTSTPTSSPSTTTLPVASGANTSLYVPLVWR